MKKVLCLMMTAALAAALLACGGTEASPADTATTESEAAEAADVVVFADPVLEARIREAMDKPDGDITVAEAEAVTELDLSTDFTADEPEEGTVITDLSGIESFINLDSLSLEFHDVTDITPLAGLTNLHSLGLGGNPVADITPLIGLTELRSLSLFNCQAEDYSPLANLVNLDTLFLEYSTITDLTPVSGLTNLKWLSLNGTEVSDVLQIANLTGLTGLNLADCPIADYSPLLSIYSNLEDKDFVIVRSLTGLGFTVIDHETTMGYKTDTMVVTVNHSDWGTPTIESDADAVKLRLNLDDGSFLTIRYYPDAQTYLVDISNDDETFMQYSYDLQDDEFALEIGDQETAETLLQTALGEESWDPLYLPVSVFDDTIRSTFEIGVEALYALPMESESLMKLGFVADEANAECVYEDYGETYSSIEVSRPEWGERDFDVLFYTQVGEYGMKISYSVGDQCYNVSAVDERVDDGSIYAAFEFYDRDDAKNDLGFGGADSVEAFFKTMYDDPEIEDVYLYSVLLMQQYIEDTFGMDVDALYNLPVEG